VTSESESASEFSSLKAVTDSM